MKVKEAYRARVVRVVAAKRGPQLRASNTETADTCAGEGWRGVSEERGESEEGEESGEARSR
jgi:hypothetical protein